jgi:putative redox protein
VRLGGDGAGPAPHELFPAALAACVSTTLGAYARTKGWDLGQVTVDVDYDNRSTPRRFDVSVQVTGALDAEQLARLEKVAAACPIRRALEAGFEFEERIVEPQRRRTMRRLTPMPPRNGRRKISAATHHDTVGATKT